MSKTILFISSVQKELAAERLAVRDFVRGDPLLRRFFDVFLFEDLPASDRRADEVYLHEVDRCGLYVGLYGLEYGAADRQGLSPTEREFNRATAKAKARLIFVKGVDDKGRHPKMAKLIREAGQQLIRRRFDSIPELTALVYASLVNFLERRGIIQDRPFDERLCLDASLGDLDTSAVGEFVRQARHERQFPLQARTPIAEVLTHLGLFRENRLTNAAILLFGRDPQRFLPCAEVRCMHFHGTEIQRPAPFYKIFKGALFAQVDQAANFVLSVTNLSVGTRALGPQAPVAPEVPPDVIREAIVNAVAHRDYTSGAAVQVGVFADRIEVWNPGELPPPLTLDSLREPHRSIARNQRICEPLFLAGYIEKYGTGTLMMIRESLAHALPEPAFQQRGGEFAAVIWRDWLTEQALAGFDLNERQRNAIVYLKIHRRITNAEYQALVGGARRTALRELASLVQYGLIFLTGGGRGAHYVLVGKRAINAPNAPSAHGGAIPEKRAINAPNKPAPVVENKHGKRDIKKLLILLQKGERSSGDLRRAMGIRHRPIFHENYLHPALNKGLIERTIPDKPNSRLQKYRLTDAGRAWLARKNL